MLLFYQGFYPGIETSLLNELIGKSIYLKQADIKQQTLNN